MTKCEKLVQWTSENEGGSGIDIEQWCGQGKTLKSEQFTFANANTELEELRAKDQARTYSNLSCHECE